MAQLSFELSNVIGDFKNYLQTEEGKSHTNYLKIKEPTETKEILKRLHTLPKQSDEFVELVLYGLLPNFKTKYAKRVSISPSFMNIRKFFGRFKYTENDWKELSLLVYNLISKFEQNPMNLDEYIREFISNRLSKGLQCGSISPVLFALNPKFPIINNREMITYRELSFHVLDQEDDLSQRLENYLPNITKATNLIEVLSKNYGFNEIKDLAVFDIFCYWYTERIKPARKTKPKTTKATKARQETPLVIPIDDSQISNFIQAMKCSEPKTFFIDITNGPFNLHKLDTEGKIIYNTEFQRGEVWDKPRKQKLIDSILRGYSINTLFFRHHLDGRYECLDGQQRLKAIRDFLNDKFPINPKITPEFNRETIFSQLPDTLKNTIRNYAVYVIIFYTDKDEETCKIFLRLQEGLPLNTAEKLNAMMGILRNLVVDMTQHPLFASLGIFDNRFSHRYIIAQVYLLTLRNQLTDAKSRHLIEMYTTYKTVKPTENVTNTVTRVFNIMEKEFGDNAKVIENNGDFTTLFWLTKYLMENYAVHNPNLGLKDFFVQFMSIVGQVETSEGTNAPYYDYKTYRKTSSDSKKSMEMRFNVMLTKFLEFNPDLQPKDPKRGYDYWEKLAVFSRDKGICQICGKAIPFDKGTVDHKIPHSKGGFTTIENGQWLCIEDNLKKLAKLPEDYK